eukprot:scaffold170818_cov65-Attheya_sp.AAC.1
MELNGIFWGRKSSNWGTTMDPRSHPRDMEIPEDQMDCSKQNSSRQGNFNQPSDQRCLICPNFRLVY